ncbi:MAG: TetR family transcriptional regulator, partial [Pseudomonadota bacterium]
MSDASPSPRRNRSPAGRNDESIRIDPASGQPSRAETRRRKIFRSLHDCIIENGYSKTTLADIAKKAGMSPSHLL